MEDEKRRRWLDAFTVRTLAVNIVLIGTIFLTRNRWEAWVVEQPFEWGADLLWAEDVGTDGNRVLAHTFGHSWLLDVETGRMMVFFGSPELSLPPVAISPDGTQIVGVGSRQRKVSGGLPQEINEEIEEAADALPLVFDTREGRFLFRLKGHTGLVNMVAYAPDGSRIATVSSDTTARLWDASTGACRAVLRGHEGRVTDLDFSPDGSRVVTASSDGTARVWEVATGKPLDVIRHDGKEVGGAEYGGGGKRILTWAREGYGDHICRIWDVGTGRRLMQFHADSVVGLSPDRGLLVVAKAEGGLITVYEMDGPREVAELQAGVCRGISVDFSPDGRRILSNEEGGDARVWDIESGECLVTLPIRGTTAEFACEGTRIAICDRNRKTAWLVDAASGELLTELRGVSACFPLRNRRIFALNSTMRILRRIRPEQWWGVFYLWHFWLIIVLSLALTASIWCDVKSLRRR